MTPAKGSTRKPLLAVCDMNDRGQDVHFMADGRCWSETGSTVVSGIAADKTNFVRRGGRFEFDAEIETPEPGGSRPGSDRSPRSIPISMTSTP